MVDEPDDDEPVAMSAGDSLRTRAGTVFGTPGFMSPGQLRGDSVGYGADVYALGASLYFVLSGHPPHHAPTGDAMMVLAAEGPPQPLADLVSGVPRELATIVDTALAYGDNRYRDASAFAEDLRRYTTGQLVASHHYSRRERLVRFVRKYRAAVSIAVVAIGVIALLATISVVRVIEARDRADGEARDAAAAQRSERERADQLLLLRARTLLDTNPTEVLALLQELAPTSPRLAEAHGIANAAILRGVARGIHGPSAATRMVDLDSTGSRLVQATIDGKIHVWDLDRGTELIARQFALYARADWVGSKIFINGGEPPSLLDPSTGVVERLSLPKLASVHTSDDQQLVIGLIEDTKEVVRIDLARKTATPVWPGHPVHSTVLAGDGSWFAVNDGKEVVVFSREGSELTRRRGDLTLASASASSRLAVVQDEHLMMLEVRPTPTWRSIDTSKYSPLVRVAVFRGEELLIGMGSGHLLAYRQGRLDEISRPELGVTFSHALGDDEHVFMVGNQTMLYVAWLGIRTIHLPQPLTAPRIAARRGVRRFAVISDDIILVYDLAQFTPKRIPAPPGSRARFFDEQTLLMSTNDEIDLWWRDLASGRDVPIDIRILQVNPAFAFEPTTGFAIMSGFQGSSSQLFRLRKSSPTAELVYDGTPIGAFGPYPGGDVIYTSTTKVALASGSTTRELVTFLDPVHFVQPFPDRRFAAISDTGELARGSVDRGELDRTRLETPATEDRKAPNGRLLSPVLDVNPEGELYAGWGKTIWKWTDRLEPVATVDGPILDIRVRREALIVLLVPNRIAMVDLATRKITALPSHGGHVLLSRDFDAMVFDVGGFYHFLDPATHVTWPTPIQRLAMPHDLTGTDRRILTRVSDRLFMWTMPDGSGPLRARLEPLSNAVISKDGLLAWPWQQR